MLRVLALIACLAAAAPLAQAQPPETHSLQGDSRAWTQDPHLHRVWEMLRVACVHGCAKADAAAFDRDAKAELRQMAAALGMTPEALAEHVNAIPRQMLQIGAEDPSILTDYDTFITALVGPP